MTPDKKARRKRRRIRLAIRRTSVLLSATAFFLMLGTVGSIETDTTPLLEGAVRAFGLEFIGIGFAFIGDAFENPKGRRKQSEVYRDTVSRPGGTSCQKSSSAW